AESEVRALPDVSGKDVVELGCGTAYWSAWLARMGARPVGVDITDAQLANARKFMAEYGPEFALIQASAEDVPLPDASFDIPFEAVPPDYEELGDDPVEHAAGKARSVDGAGRVVLGVDTDVFLDARRLGKAAGAGEAREMLEVLSGRTHEVVSGLCLRGDGWEELHRVVTAVSFRALAPGEVERYVASGEWEGRAGAYAI